MGEPHDRKAALPSRHFHVLRDAKLLLQRTDIGARRSCHAPQRPARLPLCQAAHRACALPAGPASEKQHEKSAILTGMIISGALFCMGCLGLISDHPCCIGRKADAC